MVRGTACYLGSNPVKSQFRQIELVNKGIDHPDRIVLIDPTFQAFGKQCALPTVLPSTKRFIRSSAAAKNQHRENHVKQGAFKPGSFSIDPSSPDDRSMSAVTPIAYRSLHRSEMA
jgi:hypothetical protein